jgi:hypothetical protein
MSLPATKKFGQGSSGGKELAVGGGSGKGRSARNWADEEAWGVFFFSYVWSKRRVNVDFSP